MHKTLSAALSFALLACTLSVAPVAAVATDTPTTAADSGRTILASEVTTETTPTPAPITRLEDDDLRVRFGGAWTSGWVSAASGQTMRSSSTRGARVSASFDGTGCAFVSRLTPGSGRANLYLDGVFVRTLDLYAASTTGPRSVWSTDTLAPGPHSIRVVVTGTKSAAASGASVTFDAFDLSGNTSAPYIAGTLVNNGNGNLLKRLRWVTSAREGAIGGSSWRTATKNSSVTIRFKGTAVAWLGRKDDISGKAQVILDGRPVAVVSQYRPVSVERRVAWSRTGLKYGEHTLTIKNLGQVSDPSGSTRTDVDAFAITGTLLKAYPPTPFSYPWQTYIVIDKSSYKLYWVKNKQLIKVYPIAHGKAGTPTPERVWRIDMKHYTDPSSVYGPRKMRLFKRVGSAGSYGYEYTNYAIHGTNQPWVIGTMASHGCIRMYNSDVLQLFPQVPLGTMVVTRR